ncbi:MAG: hypothetical protein IKR69_01070 [Bacteroidales bacterium]|nr:hypothetical protein [Bacteroidales bacterium]
MLEAIKQIFRARALKKNASKVETSLLKLSDIHSAAVFIDVEDTSWEEAKNMLVRYFRDRGIRAELFFFDFRKLDEGERLITSITNTILKKDMLWYGRPSKEKLDLMLPEEAPDLFLSLMRNGGFAMEYLAKSSRARFKVGRAQLPGNTYDLVVADPEGKIVSEAAALKTVFSLLEKIQ